MNEPLHTTSHSAPPSGAPREAHQRAGGNGWSFEANRLHFLNMMSAAASAQAMKDWVLGEGITAPTAVRCAVWSDIHRERELAGTFLHALGGLAAVW